MTDMKENGDSSSDPKVKKGFHIPTLEISPEREEELLESISGKIIEYGLEVPAQLFLIPFRPISPIASQLTLLPAAPLLEAFDIAGFDYVSFFKKIENVDRLLKKIEEKKTQNKSESKDRLIDRSEKSENWLSKIKKILRP